jgi:carbon-monoxide dehydrogenase small subunit
MAERRVVRLTVNGESVEGLVEPRKTLADFIRQDLELTGTHLGCEHGVCGACTVLLDGEPVRSCLLFAVQADGARVGTVEGLARDGLHPIQEAFHDHFALQCGYCTPGMLMTVYDLLQRSPSPSREDIRQSLAGNICRCTGYHAIVDAVEAAAARLRAVPPRAGGR